MNVDYIRNAAYANELTRKFKRGMYNIFLQEYHRNTGFALDEKFDRIRDFVRNDNGDLPLYYLKSSSGVRVVEDLEMSHQFPFNENSLETIEKYGFYRIMLTGLNFYIAVTETADQNLAYIINESRELIGTGFVFTGLIELKKLTEIDFTLRDWN